MNASPNPAPDAVRIAVSPLTAAGTASGAAPGATPGTTPSTTPGTAPGAAFRPQLTIYHANAKGTGCAIAMNLVPAEPTRDGCIMLSFACQRTVGDRRAPTPVYPTFDWEGKITVKLNFTDLCKMLQVFRGEREEIEGGKGLFHRSTLAFTTIHLRHLVEPVTGWSLAVHRTAFDRTQPEREAHILLTPDEALGVSIAFESAIGPICFGVPRAAEQDAAGGLEPRRMRDVRAA